MLPEQVEKTGMHGADRQGEEIPVRRTSIITTVGDSVRANCFISFGTLFSSSAENERGCGVRATILAMTRAAQDLLAEALELPLDERARFAAELLESLQEAESAVEEAWATEIQKRVAAARTGELASTDWRIVLDRVEKEVLGR